MAITTREKYLLNKMNSVASNVQLGTLIQNAETGGLANDSVSLEHLDSGIEPSHVVKYAGTFTTVGGDVNEAITVTGAAATDIVHVTLRVAGATPRTVLTAVPATNAINVVMSGDPSTDHVLQYTVLRAAT